MLGGLQKAGVEDNEKVKIKKNSIPLTYQKTCVDINPPHGLYHNLWYYTERNARLLSKTQPNGVTPSFRLQNGGWTSDPALN